MKHPKNPIIIDLEASGFGPQSYPIEVGIVLENGDRFCTLISPEEEWTHWSDSAEALHGIARVNLIAAGKSARRVAEQLNGWLEGKTVYSDGWVVDKPWLTKLFYAAGVEMKFQVSSLEMIMTEPQILLWDETKVRVTEEAKLPRHRASNDAWLIQETYRHTLVELSAMEER